VVYTEQVKELVVDDRIDHIPAGVASKIGLTVTIWLFISTGDSSAAELRLALTDSTVVPLS